MEENILKISQNVQKSTAKIFRKIFHEQVLRIFDDFQKIFIETSYAKKL